MLIAHLQWCGGQASVRFLTEGVPLMSIPLNCLNREDAEARVLAIVKITLSLQEARRGELVGALVQRMAGARSRTAIDGVRRTVRSACRPQSEADRC